MDNFILISDKIKITPVVLISDVIIRYSPEFLMFIRMLVPNVLDFRLITKPFYLCYSL